MIFANPFWFLLLIPWGLWCFSQFGISSRSRIALPYSDLLLLKNRMKTNVREEKILFVLKTAGFLMMITALARPQMVSKTQEPPKPVVDIILCLDTSLSMAALDFEPKNRLDAAKISAEEFIRKRTFDRMGLVVFGGRAITQCPLTLDHETLIDFLRSVPINATQTDGTAIGNAIALASARLSESAAKTKIVILLTDGRNNTGNIDPRTAASAANELGIKIYTIGTAVPGGGTIPVEDPVFGKRLVKMAEDLDEPALQEIALVTSAKYFRVTSTKRFKEIYDAIDKMERTKVEIGISEEHKELFLPFLLAALLLLGSEIFLKNSLWRTVP